MICSSSAYKSGLRMDCAVCHFSAPSGYTAGSFRFAYSVVFMLKISALLISNSDSDLLSSVMEDVIWNLPAEYLCINGCVTSGVKSCWLYVEHLTSMHNGNGRLLQPGLWGWSDSVGPWRTLLCNCFISADSVPVWCLTFFFLSSSCVFVLR